MTEEQRKLLIDTMDKTEDILVDLCVNKGVGWDSETYKDALVYVCRELRIVSLELLRLADRDIEYGQRIKELEKKLIIIGREAGVICL